MKTVDFQQDRKNSEKYEKNKNLHFRLWTEKNPCAIIAVKESMKRVFCEYQPFPREGRLKLMQKMQTITYIFHRLEAGTRLRNTTFFEEEIP